MCDLLPCPHRGMYDDVLGNDQADHSGKEVHKEVTQESEKSRLQDIQVSSKEKSTRERKLDKDSKFTDLEMRPTKQSEDRLRDKPDNKEIELFHEIEKLNEKQRRDDGKYKQFLEAEKPDVEKSDSERSLNSDRSTASDKIVKSDSDRSLRSDRSAASNKSVRSDRSRRDKDKRRKKADADSVELTNSEESKSDKTELRKESKDERQLRPSNDRRSNRDNETEMPSDKVQRSDDERSRSQGRKKEKLRPRLSSSPVRNVDAAIGQVCIVVKHGLC